MSVRVSYKKQFLVYVFLFLILATIIEIGSRIYEYQLSRCALLDSASYETIDESLRDKTCSDSNRLVYEKPNITVLQPNQHYDTINVNSFGFRGNEISKEKQEGTYRIFIVGGSTAFGAGATSDENTISGFLQKIFDKERNITDNIKHIEVINAGIPGANSVREYYYIKNTLLQFQPDMIVIYDGLNDAANAIINKNDLGKAPENELMNIQTDFDHIISKYFQIYRTPFVLNYIIFKSTTEISYDINSIAQMKQNWHDRWEDICKIGDSKDIKIIVTLQPILGTGNKTLYFDEITKAKSIESQATVKAINELELPLHQLSDTCLTYDLRGVFDDVKEPIFYDNGHTNVKGNEIIAKKLFEVIKPVIYEKNSQ